MLQLEKSLLMWIALGAFQAALGSKFYDTLVSAPGSPCLPGTPCLPGQAIYSPQSSPRRPAHQARPAKASFKKPTSKDPCISSFIDTFVKAVHSCDVLCNLFESFDHITSMEFCNGKYPEILEALIDIGAPNPEFASQQAVEAIVESFDTLTSDIVIQVYANSIAKYLFTQGFLKPQNSAQLAKQYADMMEEAAKCNDSPYTALKEGFVNFLGSLGLFSSDQALLIALQYGNEWKLLSKPAGNYHLNSRRG